MTSPLGEDGFSHEAFFYAGLAEFLDGACGFVREGLERDEDVLVATGGERLAALRSFFHDARGVRLVDMAEIGGNPARIIPTWRDFVDAGTSRGRRVRGIGEPVWFGRSEAELAECHQHESLLNLAFSEGPAWRLLCPYDVATLPQVVIDEARTTHPYLLDEGTLVDSDVYHPDRARDALENWPLSEPPGVVAERSFTAGDLAAVRAMVAARAGAAGLSADTVDDLVLAVDEIATNSLIYGGGGGLLRMWREPDALVCEVSDDGHIVNPLVGREAPNLERLGGRGVWLANQLCDLVQVRSSPLGTVVRLHTRVAIVERASSSR